MPGFKWSPGGKAALTQALGQRALLGAQAGAAVLAEKLGGEGSGTQYPGQPNRASAQGEYPAEQTGELRRSIAARPDPERPGAAQFGPLDDPPDYVAALHFKPPDDGGRPFLDDALQDRDVRRAVLDAVRGKP